MRRRDDERMIVTGNVHEYIEIGGSLTYKPTVSDDGRPEWSVYLAWDDGFERTVHNGRTGDVKRFKLMDSIGKYHQSVMPDDTSVTIGLVPPKKSVSATDADED